MCAAASQHALPAAAFFTGSQLLRFSGEGTGYGGGAEHQARIGVVLTLALASSWGLEPRAVLAVVLQAWEP